MDRRVRRGGIKDNTHKARCRFFDSLFTGVQNLNDPSGNPVNQETKNLIPANWKAAIILELFEDIEVDLKN